MKLSIEKKEEYNIRFAIAGSVDSGKSTFTGVIKTGILDDGKGAARKSVMKWKHELESGKSSDVSNNYITYDEEKKKRIICIYDLCGHRQYLKTTIFGISGLFIQYGIIVIGSNMGLTLMTEEHIRLFEYLDIPFFILLTKIDFCPSHRLIETKDDIRKTIKNYGQKIIYYDKLNEKNIDSVINNIITKKFIPIIPISNTTGINIDSVKKILQTIPVPRQTITYNDKITIFHIDKVFNVKGIGIIFSGTNIGANIKVGDKLYVGPITNASSIEWAEFRVKSIHNNIREIITTLKHNETGCLACNFTNKEIKHRSLFKKGMIAASDYKAVSDNITKSFIAKIFILKHSTTIKSGYQTVVNCGTIRQPAYILFKEEEKNNSLRTSNKAIVMFHFMLRAEYIEIGKRFFFTEGSTRGIGQIISIKTKDKYIK